MLTALVQRYDRSYTFVKLFKLTEQGKEQKQEQEDYIASLFIFFFFLDNLYISFRPKRSGCVERRQTLWGDWTLDGKKARIREQK